MRDRQIDPSLESALRLSLVNQRILEDALYGPLDAWTLSLGEVEFPAVVFQTERGVQFRSQVISDSDKASGHPITLSCRGEPRAVLPLEHDLDAGDPLDLGWDFSLPEGTFVG